MLDRKLCYYVNSRQLEKPKGEIALQDILGLCCLVVCVLFTVITWSSSMVTSLNLFCMCVVLVCESVWVWVIWSVCMSDWSPSFSSLFCVYVVTYATTLSQKLLYERINIFGVSLPTRLYRSVALAYNIIQVELNSQYTSGNYICVLRCHTSG